MIFQKRGCQPYIVDNAVREKITKGQAGIRWDNVVETIWKDLGGDQKEVLHPVYFFLFFFYILSIETFGGPRQK